MNKRGVLSTGVLYSVYFFMMAVIALGIYGGLIGYFGTGYDYRKAEARTMLDEVKECFFTENFDLNSLTPEFFYEKCKISKAVIEDGEHMIYIKNGAGKEFVLGVADFKNRCFLNVAEKNKDYPICASYGKDVRGEDYILVGSSQNSRRVLA
ncbi:MAG: hypothetical protein ACP5N7_06350 [Candidatus Pacearchaeota archaeon]